MSSLDDPSAFAALIAPAIDRTAISIYAATDPADLVALRDGHRFHPAALALFAGPIAAGGMSGTEYAELTRYQHFGPADAFLAGMADRGAIVLNADGSFTPTEAGRAVAERLIALQVGVATKLFAPRAPVLAEVRALIMRANAAAATDEFSSLAQLMSRTTLPADASDAGQIWHAALLLRMHRSDAHARAWTEAGLTMPQIRTMQPGPDRDSIERRTNELAATPWRGLDPEERLVLLAGLAGLPGVGSPI